jgi:hypothetical protein
MWSKLSLMLFPRLAWRAPRRRGKLSRKFSAASRRRFYQGARTKPRDSNWRAQLSTIAASAEVSPPRLSVAEHIKVVWVLGLIILMDKGAEAEEAQPKRPIKTPTTTPRQQSKNPEAGHGSIRCSPVAVGD